MEQVFSAPIAQQDVQKGPSGKAAGALARGAYTGVREHDKGPRTPLADFFNILLDLPSHPGPTQSQVFMKRHFG
jgi:hypothetical protein